MKNMKEITFDELRDIQLQMMDEIHAFCKSRNIRYSLGGGTLLGAVRHQGYIPWDDDIDIMLPRPDYDRFIHEFEGYFTDLKLQHLGNDDTCCIPFAKVFDNRTILIEKAQRSGVYIDVFPVDGLPNESKIFEYIKQWNKHIRRIQYATAFYKLDESKAKRFKYYLKRLIFPPRKKVISKFYQFLTQYKYGQTANAGAICGVYAEKELMPLDVFEHYIELTFENRRYMAIRDYDAYLSKHYGNYMELPPVEKQVSHHVFKAYWK